jgi:hypothetical protein
MLENLQYLDEVRELQKTRGIDFDTMPEQEQQNLLDDMHEYYKKEFPNRVHAKRMRYQRTKKQISNAYITQLQQENSWLRERISYLETLITLPDIL